MESSLPRSIPLLQQYNSILNFCPADYLLKLLKDYIKHKRHEDDDYQSSNVFKENSFPRAEMKNGTLSARPDAIG
jgi:hypothetical protein